MFPKVPLDSPEPQVLERRKEFLTGSQESPERVDILKEFLSGSQEFPERVDILKEQPPEQVDQAATQEATRDLRLRPRRWGLRSVQRQRGRHRRVCHLRMMGSGLLVQALGLQHRLRRRAGGTRR